MPEESNQSKFDNYSLDFNGTDELIDLGTTPIVTGIFSISMWIKRNSISVGDATQVLIGKDNQSSARVFNIFFKNITGQISFWVSSTGTYSGTYRVDTSTAINDTNWHNLIFLNKGDGQSNEIYVDGLEASYTAQGEGRSTLFNTTAIKTSIGADALTGTTFNFNGKISSVSIFDYTLSESQIKYLYNNNAGGSTPNPQNPMAIPGNSPIAYYPLGGSSTGDTAAASPNTLTVPNSSVPSATVFDFNGTLDFIEVPNSSSLQITDNLTLSCWINVNNVTINNNILDKFYDGTADGRSYLLRVQSSRIYLYLANASGTGAPSYISTSTLQNNTWYHITTTFSSTGEALKQVKIYINGSLDAEHGKTDLIASNDEEFRIGSSYNTSNRFGGKISNAQIWNSELTASEITTLYNNGTPYVGTQPQAANLKGWWRLNIDTSNWKHFSDDTASRNYWNFQNQVGSRNSVVSFGTSDYIDYPYISLSGAFTVSTWVKSSDGKPGETSYGNYLSNSNQWGGGSNNDRNWVITRFNRGVRFIGYSTSASVLWNVQTPQGGDDIPNMFDGEWHHVIAIWDGTTNSNGIKIFVDGILKGLGTSSGTNINTDNSVPIRAGSASTGFDYIGEQSNQQIWNTALTSGSASSVGDSIGGDAAIIFNGGTPYDGTQPQASNLKGWWKLDNITTGIQDSSGNSNNGTNNGTVNASSIVSTLTGRSSGMTTANLVNSDLERSIPYSSYSMTFDAVNDYINCGNDSALDIDGDLTLSCWVYPTATTAMYRGLMVKEGNFRWYTDINTPPTNVRFYDGSSAASSTGTLSVGEWHHIAITINSGVTNGSTFYIDGAASGTATFTITSNTVDLNLGRYGSYEFEGNMSNCAIWNSALSEDQILTIYNGGVPNDISSLSPVGWWSLAGDSYFNGQDWICPDLSVNSNNGDSDGTMGGSELVGNGPGSEANGVATGMNIPGDLQGNAPNSSSNAFSVNMNADDKTNDVPVVP